MRLRSFALVVAVLTALPVVANAQDQVTISASTLAETRNGVSGGSALGGQLDASTYGSTPSGPCRGWVSAAPNHVLNLTAPVALTVAVDAPGADTALLVIGPGGTFCNDDTNGLNPAITQSLMPGTYNVWVASYAANSNHNYTIRFTNLAPVAATPPTPPVVPTPPVAVAPPVGVPTGGDLTASGLDVATFTPSDPAGALTLGPGFMPDPQMRAGNVTGTVSVAGYGDNKGNPCVGYVPSQPSHVFNAASEFPYLRVTVQSGSDTVMVVRSPAGDFVCVDDTYGFDPSVEGSFAAGSWRIWVGTYNPGETASYAIQFSEIPVQ